MSMNNLEREIDVKIGVFGFGSSDSS